MTERLVHFADRVITALVPSSYDQRKHLGKPDGFWVSVEGNGDGWSDWCRDEQFGIERLAHPHEITLAADARILRITTPEDIDALGDEYGIHDDFAGGRFRVGIDWARVAERYQGVLITPYQWTRRLSDGSGWYYGWDCASGCIWDLAAIDRITPPCICFETFAGMTDRDHAPMCPVSKAAVARTRWLNIAKEATT